MADESIQKFGAFAPLLTRIRAVAKMHGNVKPEGNALTDEDGASLFIAHLLTEAGDEIERLRAENERLRAHECFSKDDLDRMIREQHRG